MDALRKEEYTYADYAKWPNDVRYELIDGEAVMLAAPSWQHQSICGEIFRHIANFLKGRQCKAFMAPFDVRLNAFERDDTVVQPDIVVVCDRSKLSGTGCVGAPDMVVEVLSPSTTGMDTVLKFKKYLRAGVREYWIVDPDRKTVLAHLLKDGGYMTSAYAESDRAESHVLEGFAIDIGDIFAQ